MADKLYTVRLQTRNGDLLIKDVEEFVLARKYFYYHTKDTFGCIKRSDLKKAYRLIEGSTTFVEIKSRRFVKKDDIEDGGVDDGRIAATA